MNLGAFMDPEFPIIGTKVQFVYDELKKML